MQIDTVIYFQIIDPKLYAYGVEHPLIFPASRRRSEAHFLLDLAEALHGEVQVLPGMPGGYLGADSWRTPAARAAR